MRVEARRTSQKRTRIAVLGLVLVVMLVSAALPLRDYLAQRSEIGKLQLRQQQAQARVIALEQERDRLQDDTYIAAEARRRLHFVLPGETAYVLLEPEPVPEAEAAAPGEGAPAEAQAPPWYTQLWGSVRAADRPAAE
ncbi:MAG: septum formation initiator family protein [Actinobacteria bacterium]|nr:septum formation initiator family protein [Actinomycetota bacterium]MBW3648069.1 septum formation initiator family protein [Actinomycetota bacterium]